MNKFVLVRMLGQKINIKVLDCKFGIFFKFAN